MRTIRHTPEIEDLLASGGRYVWPLLREQFPTDDHLFGMLAQLWDREVREALATVTSGRRRVSGAAARDAAFTLAGRRDPALRALLDAQSGRRVVALLERRLGEWVDAALGLAGQEAAPGGVVGEAAPAVELAVPGPRQPVDDVVPQVAV